jgi:hypothetical protein
MRRLTALGLAAIQLALLGACATLTGDPTQVLQIETVDEHGRAIEGMRCHLSNASSDYFGDSPMYGLEVHRSASNLKITCRQGDRVAQGTAVSRGGVRGAAAMLLPGGTAYMMIDHLSGYRYTYPTWLRLQVGQTLTFDASNDVAGKPVPGRVPDNSPPPVAGAPVMNPAVAPKPAVVQHPTIVRSD